MKRQVVSDCFLVECIVDIGCGSSLAPLDFFGEVLREEDVQVGW